MIPINKVIDLDIKVAESKSEIIQHEETKEKGQTNIAFSNISQLKPSKIATTHHALSVISDIPITNDKDLMNDSLKKVAILLDIEFG
jgi:hypothetical protein